MNGKVIVVEDGALIRLDAVDLLEVAGLEVVELSSADDAANSLANRSRDVSVIFTDTRLPARIDGADLARLTVKN